MEQVRTSMAVVYFALTQVIPSPGYAAVYVVSVNDAVR